MFPIFDHIDTLIAADFYEENNQPFLSEAMKLLNRPCLEFVNLKRVSVCRANRSRNLCSWTQMVSWHTNRSWTKAKRWYQESRSVARRGWKTSSSSSN